MYHDKIFQMDPAFALIAMNIEQMKESNIGGYLKTQRKGIDRITEHIKQVNEDVLDNIINQLKNKEMVKPVTADEKIFLHFFLH